MPSPSNENRVVKKKMLLLSIAGLAGVLCGVEISSAIEEADVAPLKRWVESQGRMESLMCSFTQEKKLRALRKPLVAKGKIWFRAPGDFRWELGDPARTILFHSEAGVTMVDVPRKRARIVRPREGGPPAGSVDYFNLGFPRSWASFEETFEILSLKREQGLLVAELSPKSRTLAKGVTSVRFVIEMKTQKLRRMVFDLRDHSTITTTFDNAVRNEAVSPSVFEPDLEGFTVKEIE